MNRAAAAASSSSPSPQKAQPKQLPVLRFAPSPNHHGLLPAFLRHSPSPPPLRPPMRIRRRPPGQPLLYLLPTDPYPAPPPASASRDHPPPPPPPGDNQQQRGEGDLHLQPAASATNGSAADLGAVARSSSSSPLRQPALPPQDGAAVAQRSRAGGALLGLGALQQQQGPADHGRHSSLENGLHRHAPEPATKQQQENKDTGSGGGAGSKRAPRGPGTLKEGSRCSRKNGRGWRCSQPTLVGYALCEYHLGKGRMKSGSAVTVGRRPGQLGRTEHANKKASAAAAVVPATATAAAAAAAAAVVPATAAAGAPKADVLPPPTTSVPQHG